MIEVTGNLWTYKLPDGSNPDVRVITTNGAVRKDGACVMGRGCALEAAKKWPALPFQLGNQIKIYGNKVFYFDEPNLFTFPVKHHWREEADLELIKQSAYEIQARAIQSWETIVMPRPGCGNGRLSWDTVKDVISPILDNRFHIITW